MIVNNRHRLGNSIYGDAQDICHNDTMNQTALEMNVESNVRIPNLIGTSFPSAVPLLPTFPSIIFFSFLGLPREPDDSCC
jgi:hypothetical protein